MSSRRRFLNIRSLEALPYTLVVETFTPLQTGLDGIQKTPTQAEVLVITPLIMDLIMGLSVGQTIIQV